jgi:predicted permease
MDRFLLDLWQILRSLAKQKTLGLGATLTLALGIGATTTLFSIVRGATSPLPFADSHDLVALAQRDRSGVELPARDFDYLAWSEQQTSLDPLAAFRSADVNIADADLPPERRSAAALTPATFELLGVDAARGRLFDESDLEVGAPSVVLISEDLWLSRYDGAPDVLGSVIRIDGEPHTVVGVMPSGFGFPVNEQLWTPLRIDPAAQPDLGSSLTVFGRLRDGRTLDQARTEFEGASLRLAQTYPGSHQGRGIRVIPFVDVEMDPEAVPVLYLMLLAVSFVLAIACANVANLLLARAVTRTRDVAIRTALGASRRRLIRQQLIESLAIAAIGGVGGVLIAHVGVRFFDVATANIIEAFWIDFHIDGAVLVFATLLVGLAAVAAGLLPALRSSTTPPAVLLKDAGAASGLRIGRLGKSLVIGELALVCGFLAVSGTFVKTAIGLRAIEMPFDGRSIFTGSLSFGGEGTGAEEQQRVLRELVTTLEAAPGIENAALVSTLPGRGAGNSVFTLDGSEGQGQSTGLVRVTPGFLATLGARVTRGRDFAWTDDGGAARVALVNQSWVSRFSPDRDPIGRQLSFPLPQAPGQPPRTAPSVTIVGIVPDLQMQNPGEAQGDGVYVPILQSAPFSVRMLARGSADPLSLLPVVRERVQAIHADLPLFEVATLHDAIYADASVLDAFGVLFAAFGGGALFLALIGVYGVVAFGVSQRTREYGVRIALGARREDVLQLVLRQGGRPVVIGVTIGLVLALTLGRLLAAMIEVVEPADFAVTVGVIGVLGLTAVTALLVPARRAAAIEPLQALRQD